MCINPQIPGTCDRSAHADRQAAISRQPLRWGFSGRIAALQTKRDEIMSTVAVVGLGYVGLPLAVAFGKKLRTIGFDLSAEKVESYRRHVDPTGEVSGEELRAATRLTVTTDPAQLAAADIIVVAVPTPVDTVRQPDFGPLIGASTTVGKHMKNGAIVVYESTVYPGATVAAGVYRASSIKVAEAAKVIENTQRDLNIALVNELAIIFNRIGIDTLEVLQAAGTKWNFLPFRPGLVGGHCIGVDPYYLTHKADMIGYHPQVILAGRRINDGMGKFIAEQTVKHMIRNGSQVKGSRVNVLGLTFKENCPDIRNSRGIDLIHELKSYGVDIHVHDPVPDAGETRHEYGLELEAWEALPRADALVVAVAHRQFVARPLADYLAKVVEHGCFIDVKRQFDMTALQRAGLTVWRL